MNEKENIQTIQVLKSFILVSQTLTFDVTPYISEPPWILIQKAA